MDIRRTSFDKHEGSQNVDKVVKRRREQKQRFESTSSVSSVLSDSPSLRSNSSSTVPDPQTVAVDIAGYLHKQGRILKQWKQRYFEIQGNCMYCYKNTEKKECLGYIDLYKSYYVGSTTAASFGSSFELQTWDRTHLLAARSESDMKKWIEAIKDKMLPEAKVRQQKGTRNDVESTIPQIQRSNRATVKLSKSGKNKQLSSSSSPSHELSRKRAKSVPRSHNITLEDKDSLTSHESSSTSLSASLSFPTIKGSTTNVINESHPVNTREQDNSPVSSNSNKKIVPLETSSPPLPLQVMDKPPSSPPKSSSKIYTGPVDMDTPPVPPQRIIKTSPESSSSPIEQLREILSNDWNETRSHDMSYDSILPPLNETWVAEETYVEQLRHFLKVCA